MKMNVRRQFLSVAAVAGLALGGLGAMAFTGNAQPPAQAQSTSAAAKTSADAPTEPDYTGSITIDPAVVQGLSESDEAAALQGLATIDASTAEAAATTANPGATVVKSELENENGYLVYAVELSNGLDVKVDAGDGTVLQSEQDDHEEESNGEGENEQEEQDGDQEKDDDAAEMNETDEGNESGETDSIQDESGEQDENEQGVQTAVPDLTSATETTNN